MCCNIRVVQCIFIGVYFSLIKAGIDSGYMNKSCLNTEDHNCPSKNKKVVKVLFN